MKTIHYQHKDANRMFWDIIAQNDGEKVADTITPDDFHPCCPDVKALGAIVS